MYATHELYCELEDIDFNPRAIDCYLAARPWASDENEKLYDKAVESKEIENVRNLVSFAYFTHTLQLPDSKQLTNRKEAPRYSQYWTNAWSKSR